MARRTLLERTLRRLLGLQLASALIGPEYVLLHIPFEVRVIDALLCEYELVDLVLGRSSGRLPTITLLPLLVCYVLRLLLLEGGLGRIVVVNSTRLRLLRQHLVVLWPRCLPVG